MYFNVPVSWTMMGNHVVQAKDKPEAIEKVYEMDLPKESEYLCDSYEVDKDSIEEIKESRKFSILALFTQHIRPEDAIWFNQKDCPLMSCQKRQRILGRNASVNYGWFVFFVEDDLHDQNIPESIRACLRYAVEHGCDCIMFDCDEEQIKDLPTYNTPHWILGADNVDILDQLEPS